MTKGITLTLVRNILLDTKGQAISLQGLDKTRTYDLVLNHADSELMHSLHRSQDTDEISQIVNNPLYSRNKFYIKENGVSG